jgi:GT2 family glycosyltransferase
MADGCEYHTPEVVDRDFGRMAQAGLNCVRVYTVPPRWLLDCALRHNLRVMVGLPWEQHITFLDDAKRVQKILNSVREGVRSIAGHPALLAFAVGNEIPAPIVRWYGHVRIERFIRRLYKAVKAEDASALVTYVNYPSTEYLHVPFLDLTCFNVYLETKGQLEGYLARLQNIAGDRPLLMAEIGLDSLRNGDAQQGRTLEWQIETVFAAGCAGTFVFAWTDEWFRGGNDILDWKFGLTTIERQPKPALDVVARAYANTPFPMDRSWPRVSVVVCTHNGARTIRRTMEGLSNLEYSNFEVIVVDDRSTDDTARIVQAFDAKILKTTEADGGLSAARNLGLSVASGEIVAYIDDDAYPDEHWLMYLADAFERSSHAGIGGPNIAPPDGQTLVARCVDRSPGNPTHVLLTDRQAEHLPGCNMAFRAEALRAIGGFDAQFRIAGDDVDVCWRIQQCGWTLGFSAGAMVWHSRRDGVRRFWRQQYHYGAAEGQLHRKWPEKYAGRGRIAWAGRVYSQGAVDHFGHGRRRVFHGVWGSALFQSVYEGKSGFLESFGLMPEWYALVAVLLVAAAVGLFWRPLLWGAAPPLAVALLVPMAQAAMLARRATGDGRVLSVRGRLLTAFLHLMQPLARATGRGLAVNFSRATVRDREATATTPAGMLVESSSNVISVWHETWASGEERLEAVERNLREGDVRVSRGGDYDRWDLHVRGGLLGAARVRMTIEEHGGGKQMARYRVWPRGSATAWVTAAAAVATAAAAAVMGAWVACAAAGAAGAAVAGRGAVEARKCYRAVRAAAGVRRASAR